MKKLLVVLLSLLIFTGCSSEKQEVVDQPVVEEPVEEVVPEVGPIDTEENLVGGWSINTSLPEMNDAIFNNARQKPTDAIYSPIVLLGTQPVAGENLMYLAYSRNDYSDTKPSLKVVTVYNNIESEGDASIIKVADFDLLSYLDGYGTNTPEGLMGGWQDNDQQPNLLSTEEKEVFDKAIAGLVGMAYTPIATLATQVVAGTNYAFLAITTEDYPIRHLYVIKVYADLQGNAEITNECGIDLSSFN